MRGVFWLSLLFVVASGLSAYIGNEWGRKIGKRKLSVFSLRPRHSSTFLTILLAMALSLGLLGTTLVLVPDLRLSLMHPGEQAETRYEREIEPLADGLKQWRLHLAQKRAATVKLAVVPTPTAAPASVSVQTQSSVQQERAEQPTDKVAGPSQLKTAVGPTEPESLQLAAHTRPTLAALPQSHTAQVRHLHQSPSLASGLKADLPRQPRERHLPPARSATGETLQLAHLQAPETTDPPSFAAPVFALQVNGGLSSRDSDRLLRGVVDLTRAYARLISPEHQSGPLIQVRSAELQSSSQTLARTGAYLIEIQLASPVEQEGPRPVRLAVKPAAMPQFDPNQILEARRLNQDQAGGEGSLKADLHLAMLQLAKDSGQNVAPTATSEREPAPALDFATAQLPFEFLRLERQGPTLQAWIRLMHSDSPVLPPTNLTQN